MKKKLVLTILLLTFLSSCETTKVKTTDITIPSLETVRPVKPVDMIVTDASTVSDLLNNYNEIIGYSNKQDDYIDSLELYTQKIIKVLINNDL